MITEEHLISSTSTGYSRKAWYLAPGNGRAERIGLFLDGEYYVDRMDAVAVIRDLESRGEIPSMACVFVSHVDGAARHADLTCNPAYTRFLVEDVLGWVRARHPELPSGGHLIGGTSLGGLAAAFAALNHPELFSYCLCHSGSFWWQRECLRSQLETFQTSKTRFWISVGDRETQTGSTHPPTGLVQQIAQVPACERFAKALRERNHAVHYRLNLGGHEIRLWKAELPEALRWLLHPEATTLQTSGSNPKT